MHPSYIPLSVQHNGSRKGHEVPQGRHTFFDLLIGITGQQHFIGDIKTVRHAFYEPAILILIGISLICQANYLKALIAVLFVKTAQEAGFVHAVRSAEHTSEIQSLMRISYAVFCLKKKTPTTNKHQ